MSAGAAPSAGATSATATPRADLDAAVAAVGENRTAFARLPAAERRDLLRATLPLLAEVAPAWIEAACRAKGIALGTPLEGEEWQAAVVPTVRNVRLLAESLDQIARHGRPSFGHRARTRSDGRVEVEVLPAGGWDGLVFRGLTCAVLMQPGLDEAGARAQQAGFYQRSRPEGKVSLILGAGNVASIPPMDVLYKMFVDGNVCVLKMNPVNEWVGPMLQRALAPLVERGFLRIVYGGGDAGAYLCQHPGVEDIHITGSDRTHDLIVWGPPGPEQVRRKREGKPVLQKPITSELGNVSPVAVVPGAYSDAELAFQARSIVSMVANNASFNCNAGKMLITARGWPQRDRFLALVRKGFGEVPARRAYYPGARERYAALTGGRPNVQAFGDGGPDTLPWTMISDVDAGRADDPLFSVEPFCAILSQTELDASDPAGFLAAATSFCNDRLWGTLNAGLVVDRRTEGDPAVAAALDRAILDLRYGTVAVNVWPAVGYATVSPPWGGHPSATLANIQSGLGWVHNTFMLEGIEKSVLRSPSTLSPKPAWYYDNRMSRVIGRRLASFEMHPRAWSFPPLVMASLRG